MGPSMGQQPRNQINMNPSAPARSSGYHQKAMEEIHISLLPFAKTSGPGDVVGSSAASTISNFSTTSGASSLSSTSGSNGTTEKDYHQQLKQMVLQLHNMGYSEVRAGNKCIIFERREKHSTIAPYFY